MVTRCIKAGVSNVIYLTTVGAGLDGVLSFFFERTDDFKEVREFVDAMDAHYMLQVRKMHGDFKAGLEQLVTASSIRAIFLGTRRCDTKLFADYLPSCGS